MVVIGDFSHMDGCLECKIVQRSNITSRCMGCTVVTFFDTQRKLEARILPEPKRKLVLRNRAQQAALLRRRREAAMEILEPPEVRPPEAAMEILEPPEVRLHEVRLHDVRPPEVRLKQTDPMNGRACTAI